MYASVNWGVIRGLNVVARLANLLCSLEGIGFLFRPTFFRTLTLERV